MSFKSQDANIATKTWEGSFFHTDSFGPAETEFRLPLRRTVLTRSRKCVMVQVKIEVLIYVYPFWHERMSINAEQNHLRLSDSVTV
jgi:hypothetical protein